VAYVRVRGKFALAVALSAAWMAFTFWIALPWASYNRSAGFGTPDGYWYRVIGVTVIVPF